MTAPTFPNIPAPIDVFISYSHEDDYWRKELEKHLSNLKRQREIADWSDRKIEAGLEWEAQLKDKLESSPIILLLISADFLDSDYCYDIEMQRAIERHDAGTAKVIPIILRPCDWQHSKFSKLQVLPQNGEAVTLWKNQDSAFLDVVQGIRRSVDSLNTRLQSKSPNPATATAANINSSAENQLLEKPVEMNQVNADESTGVQNHTSGGVTYIADNIINGGFHQPGWKVNIVNQVQGDLNISESNNLGQVKDEKNIEKASDS